MKRNLGIGCLVVAIGFIGVAMWPVLHHWFTRPSRDTVQTQFDHVAILDAARKMLDAVPANTGFGWTSNPGNPIDDPRIPKLIRDLRPTHVNVHEDHVRIEFGSGPDDHYGLFAYRKGTPDPFRGTTLIDGLTYYSD